MSAARWCSNAPLHFNNWMRIASPLGDFAVFKYFKKLHVTWLSSRGWMFWFPRPAAVEGCEKFDHLDCLSCAGIVQYTGLNGFALIGIWPPRQGPSARLAGQPLSTITTEPPQSTSSFLRSQLNTTLEQLCQCSRNCILETSLWVSLKRKHREPSLPEPYRDGHAVRRALAYRTKCSHHCKQSATTIPHGVHLFYLRSFPQPLVRAMQKQRRKSCALELLRSFAKGLKLIRLEVNLTKAGVVVGFPFIPLRSF